MNELHLKRPQGIVCLSLSLSCLVGNLHGMQFYLWENIVNISHCKVNMVISAKPNLTIPNYR